MQLNFETLKSLILEELNKLLQEGINYTTAFSPDSAAIFYVDSDENGENRADYEKGLEGIQKASERGFSQSVPFGTPEYNKMKEYYIEKGFEFQSGGGMTEKVKPPNTKDFVDFVFRYVKPTKGK